MTARLLLLASLLAAGACASPGAHPGAAPPSYPLRASTDERAPGQRAERPAAASSPADSVSSLLAAGSPGPGLRPIRTNTPGTGVFIGSGLVGQLLWDRRSGDGIELETFTSVLDFRYTPATHWVFGARVPWILSRQLRGLETGGVSTSGPASPHVGVKHRFYRSVGRWSDRHAAVEFELGLPFGRRRSGAGLPVDPLLQDRLRPASGGTDGSVELIYQEGRRRFVYGGDLSFRRHGRTPESYRRGDQVRFDFDLEYIVLPLEYRRPGDEVFLLLEGSLLRRDEDELEGEPVEGSGRSELLLAPGVQHVATEQTLLSVSFQFPVWQSLGGRELERDFNLLVEIRHAF